MSIIYRVVLHCDRCDEDFDLAESHERPVDEAWRKQGLPKGWNDEVNEGDAQYGHACPTCINTIKKDKETRP